MMTNISLELNYRLKFLRAIKVPIWKFTYDVRKKQLLIFLSLDKT